MSFNELVQTACAEPTLAKALSWIAVWENDRVVKQAFRNAAYKERNPDGSLYDTCFEFLFKEVLESYEAH